MTDPFIAKLADVLVDYSLEIREGDIFRINSQANAFPLIKEVYRRAVKRGAFPFVDTAWPELSEIFVREACEAALERVSPIEKFKMETMTANLTLWADDNTQAMSGCSPERMAKRQRSHTEIVKRFMERASGENPELRWCGSLFPTNALAQDAHMSLADYESFVFHAMLLDTEDPLASWRAMRDKQNLWADWLAGHDEIHVQAEDTDLRLRTKGRKWISCHGQKNFPDGEVFTGPIEDSANGHIRYSFPTVFAGREAEDVHLWFEDGLVTRWEARRGRELLDELLAMDDGARRLGEFAIGTNYSVPTFTKNILFDEKIGGTCHLAVGASIPDSGGVNQSALHWDMVCDLRNGGAVSADGEVFHESGQWKI
jgi:aminopeptidase